MSSIFSRKKHHAKPMSISGSSSGYTSSQAFPWSAHAPRISGRSPSPFPRGAHAITTSANAAGELFLFGGYSLRTKSPTNDLYVISTRDYHTTLLKTSGDIPSPRFGHTAVLANSSLLIWGGETDKNGQIKSNDKSIYLFNLVSREWTRIEVAGPGPVSRRHHTMTLVGSKLFVFGGKSAKSLNDIWALDLKYLNSNPFWESYEPTSGEKPRPRAGHVAVSTDDHIIIFGGYDGKYESSDTWSFDILTRKWTQLECNGSIPDPRQCHAAALIGNVIYVFGGNTRHGNCPDELSALNLSNQEWTTFQGIGPSPSGRWSHAMASDGRRIFVLGGKFPSGAPADEAKPIHILNTEHLIFPKPNFNPARLHVSVRSHRTESSDHATLVPPTPASEISFSRSEQGRIADLERQLEETLSKQSKREKQVAVLTSQLDTLLARAEADAADAAEAKEPEQRDLQEFLLKSRDEALEKAQSALLKASSAAKANEQSQQELTELRAEVNAMKSESARTRLQLEKLENDRSRNQPAPGPSDMDQVINGMSARIRRLEDGQALRGRLAKGMADLVDRNE